VMNGTGENASCAGAASEKSNAAMKAEPLTAADSR
jgi:hypothetical protein